MDFLEYNFPREVTHYLNTHTKTMKAGAASKFRDSKKNAFKWKESMSFQDIQNIQDDCMDAISLWGYRVYKDEIDLKEDPLNYVHS